MYKCLYCGLESTNPAAHFCSECGPNGPASNWSPEDVDLPAKIRQYAAVLCDFQFDTKRASTVDAVLLKMRERLKISHATHVSILSRVEKLKDSIAHLANFQFEFNENVTDAYARHDTFLNFRYTNRSDTDMFKVSLFWDDPETPDRIDLRGETKNLVKPRSSVTIGGSAIFDRIGIKELADFQITITDQFGESAKFRTEPFSFKVGNHDQRISQNISTHNQISIEGRGVIDASGMGAERASVTNTDAKWRELSFSYIFDLDAIVGPIIGQNEPADQLKLAEEQQKINEIEEKTRLEVEEKKRVEIEEAKKLLEASEIQRANAERDRKYAEEEARKNAQRLADLEEQKRVDAANAKRQIELAEAQRLAAENEKIIAEEESRKLALRLAEQEKLKQEAAERHRIEDAQRASGTEQTLNTASVANAYGENDTSQLTNATPSKGSLAKLGGMVIVVSIAVFGFYWVFVNVLNGKKNDAVEIKNVNTQATQASGTHQEAPTAVQSMPQTNAASVMAESNSSAQASGSGAVIATSEPNGSQISKEILNEILAKAASADWQGVDDLIRSNKPMTYEWGDRKSARNFNKAGLDHMSKNDFDNAIIELEKATNASRNDVEIRNNLGYAELKAKHFEKATGYFLDTLLIDPTRASAWANVAEVFAERDKKAAAEAALRLSMHFSRNQAKTLEYYTASLPQLTSDKYRSILSSMLPQLENVPQFAR